MCSQAPIVFYDGTCGMCSASVRWILKNDEVGVLRFAPLQGETFAKLDHPAKPKRPLGSEGQPGGSMVVVDAEGIWTHSDSTLRLLYPMGEPWR